MSRDRTRRLDFLPLISEDPEDEDNDFEQLWGGERSWGSFALSLLTQI